MGNFFEAFVNRESFDIYICKKCGKAEFFIPLVVDNLISEGKVRVKILKTRSKWFGVTYRQDKSTAVASIDNLIKEGVYPRQLR
jgi:hypothetical protein